MTRTPPPFRGKKVGIFPDCRPIIRENEPESLFDEPNEAGLVRDVVGMDAVKAGSNKSVDRQESVDGSRPRIEFRPSRRWRIHSQFNFVRPAEPHLAALFLFGRPGPRRRNDAGQLERTAAWSAEELVLGLGGLAQTVDLDEPERGR